MTMVVARSNRTQSCVPGCAWFVPRRASRPEHDARGGEIELHAVPARATRECRLRGQTSPHIGAMLSRPGSPMCHSRRCSSARVVRVRILARISDATLLAYRQRVGAYRVPTDVGARCARAPDWRLRRGRCCASAPMRGSLEECLGYDIRPRFVAQQNPAAPQPAVDSGRRPGVLWCVRKRMLEIAARDGPQ